MTSKTRLTLDLKDSQSFDTLILHRGDSKSRVIEIELTDNHAPVTLTSGMSATINASTNGIVVADGEKATVDTANNIISFTVTDNMTSLPGQSKISLTVSEGDTIITAQTFRAIVTDSVINEGSKFEPTGGTVKQFMDEVAAARGDYDNLNARFDSKIDNTAGSVKTDNIANKAVTSDKIANGAITALKIASGAVSGSNIAQYQISTNHLQSGAVTVDKLANNVIETGNGNLNIPEGDDGKTQSATFKYQRVGDYVDVSIYIVFNDFTTGIDTRVGYGNLPYVCKDDLTINGACAYNKKLVDWYIADKTNGINLKLPDNTIFISGTNLTFNIKYRIA